MYMLFWKRWLDFSGRSRRREFWTAILYNTILSVLLALVDSLILGFFLTYMVFLLACLIPGLALNIRRLHDIGRSGWWCLIMLVPVIGAILYLIMLFKDSYPGTNRFGPSAKYPFDNAETERLYPTPPNNL